MVSATTARSRRRQRLRSTAVPTLRGTAYAKRRASSASGAGRNWTLTGPENTRLLERRKAAKELRPWTGRGRGARSASPQTGTSLPIVVRDQKGVALSQADNRTRPRRRRAFITARPARVAMRWRKPCLLDLLRVLGWNVRFISASFRRSGCRYVCGVSRRGEGPVEQVQSTRQEDLCTWRAKTRVHQTAGTGRGNLAHHPPLDQAAGPRAGWPTALYDSGHTLRARPAVHTCGCWCGELLDRRASSW